MKYTQLGTRISRSGWKPHRYRARTLKHLTDNLGAVDLTLDEKTTAELDAVSAPAPGGYPYGAFGAWQRGRDLKEGSTAPPAPFSAGSDHPTGAA